MRIIPVLDLQRGRAVHAVAGDRAHYQPVRSLLHDVPDPIGLALAYRDTLGLRDLYLADLDAIAGAPPALPLYRDLHAMGLSLWADSGVIDRASLSSLMDAGVSRIVVGLETVRGPHALAGIIDLAGPDRVAFSLDLRDGLPEFAEGAEAEWGTNDPRALAGSVLALGVRRLLLLDLACVGTGRGVGTMELLSRLSNDHPEVGSASAGESRAQEIESLAVPGRSPADRLGPARRQDRGWGGEYGRLRSVTATVDGTIAIAGSGESRTLESARHRHRVRDDVRAIRPALASPPLVAGQRAPTASRSSSGYERMPPNTVPNSSAESSTCHPR
jgi:phosphoribosylformimino-5-aminoimidazole carboxamide ribotide isomerase